MIVIAAFESPAVVTGLDDVAMVGKAVEQRGCHFDVAEHAGPFSEGEIGGDDDGGALIEPAGEMEQKLATGFLRDRSCGSRRDARESFANHSFRTEGRAARPRRNDKLQVAKV